MTQAKTQTISEAKKYKLSDEEKANIKFRRKVIDYLVDTVNNDIGAYLYNVVRPRLGFSDDAKIEISSDEEWLLDVTNVKAEEPGKIIIPNGAKK